MPAEQYNTRESNQPRESNVCSLGSLSVVRSLGDIMPHRNSCRADIIWPGLKTFFNSFILFILFSFVAEAGICKVSRTFFPKTLIKEQWAECEILDKATIMCAAWNILQFRIKYLKESDSMGAWFPWELRGERLQVCLRWKTFIAPLRTDTVLGGPRLWEHPWGGLGQRETLLASLFWWHFTSSQTHLC